MSEEARDLFKQILPGLFVSLIASVCVGAFASYMTGSVMLAKLETRLERAEADITHTGVMINATQSEIKSLHLQRSNDREAFIRLESKIDLILQQQIREDKQR